MTDNSNINEYDQKVNNISLDLEEVELDKNVSITPSIGLQETDMDKPDYREDPNYERKGCEKWWIFILIIVLIVLIILGLVLHAFSEPSHTPRQIDSGNVDNFEVDEEIEENNPTGLILSFMPELICPDDEGIPLSDQSA